MWFDSAEAIRSKEKVRQGIARAAAFEQGIFLGATRCVPQGKVTNQKLQGPSERETAEKGASTRQAAKKR